MARAGEWAMTVKIVPNEKGNPPGKLVTRSAGPPVAGARQMNEAPERLLEK